LGAGVLAKLVLNLILVPNPAFGACGAAWASVVCHVIAFTIASTALRKNIKLNLPISKILIKPLIAVAIMGICSYFTYSVLIGIIAKKLATLIAIIVAVIIYVLAIVALRVFSKEEILQLPSGNKIYGILEKMKIY
jgi:putative stage V sporulation protein B